MERQREVWAAHPVLAAAVRIAVVLVPLSLSIVSGILLARTLPVGDTPLSRIGWWLAIFAGSTVVLFASDRIGRRLLPLAVLLELSLVFPDAAPSRLRSVRTASVRDLEQRLARLRAHGASSPPIEAAETLVTLVGTLGLHDKRTRGHSERVRGLVDLITDELKLPDEDRSRIRWAALVHDLGKLTVPASLLNKAGSLDDDEWETVRRHPDEGVRLVAGLLPWLGEWGRAVGEHHERWDGLGYPNGLAGEQISLSARIVAVADSYEVMTSARSYQRPRSAALARAELTACAGAQFDPHVVRAFLSISLGRLKRLLGPLSWLGQVSYLAIDRGGQAARLGAVSLGVGGLAVTGGLAPPASGEPRQPVAAPTATSLATPLPAPGAGASPLPAPAAAQTSPASARPSSLPQPSPAPRTLQAAPRTTAAAPAPTTSVRPTGAPSDTYWFAGEGDRHVLSPSAPTASGPPPDTDGDGRPGRTLVRTDAGLDTTRSSERLVLSLLADRDLRLQGVPTVALWSRLVSERGNGRVQVQLQDCGPSGRCTVLADGQVEDGTWAPEGAFSRHDIKLDAVDVVVANGHELRLTLVALANGTRDDLLVGLRSRSTPSLIELPVRR